MFVHKSRPVNVVIAVTETAATTKHFIELQQQQRGCFKRMCASISWWCFVIETNTRWWCAYDFSATVRAECTTCEYTRCRRQDNEFPITQVDVYVETLQWQPRSKAIKMSTWLLVNVDDVLRPSRRPDAASEVISSRTWRVVPRAVVVRTVVRSTRRTDATVSVSPGSECSSNTCHNCPTITLSKLLWSSLFLLTFLYSFLQTFERHSRYL